MNLEGKDGRELEPWVRVPIDEIPEYEGGSDIRKFEKRDHLIRHALDNLICNLPSEHQKAEHELETQAPKYQPPLYLPRNGKQLRNRYIWPNQNYITETNRF